MASKTGTNHSRLARRASPAVVAAGAPVAPAGSASSSRQRSAPDAAGEIEEKFVRLVDPGRCRVWAHHNRRYDLLSADACADLLESLRAQGAQEFPAIVRRVTDDPAVDYEVICGARRHWSVKHLRLFEHRDIKFLIEERELSDEEAFRLADVENRARQDISDYERALDYRHAVSAYYGGVAKRMAERLEVSEAWLSRFLDLAKLPQPIIDAFGDIRELRANHARELKPLLDVREDRDAVLAAAARLAEVQTEARARGAACIEAPKVVLALRRAANEPTTAAVARRSGGAAVTNADGAKLFTLTRTAENRLVLKIMLDAPASDDDFVKAFRQMLKHARAAG